MLQRGALEEAAQCKIHTAALVIAHLAILKPSEAVTVEKLAFKNLSPNLSPEIYTPQSELVSLSFPLAFTVLDVLYNLNL